MASPDMPDENPSGQADNGDQASPPAMEVGSGSLLSRVLVRISSILIIIGFIAFFIVLLYDIYVHAVAQLGKVFGIMFATGLIVVSAIFGVKAGIRD